MSLPTIFSTCRPRADVLAGTVRDDEFMADLSRVVNGTAAADYLDPIAFFAKSYPIRGMQELLKAVCLRLSGKGGEVSPSGSARSTAARLTRSSPLSTPFAA